MESFASMHSRDRCALGVQWRTVRKTLRDVLQDKRVPSMRTIQERTGVAPSTLVRWCKDTDQPLDLNRVVRVLETLQTITVLEFFARIEGLPTHDVSETLLSPAPHPQGNHGDPVQTTVVGDTFRNQAVLVAIGEAIADAIGRGFDRIIKAREQTPTTGAATPKRNENRGKTG